MTPELGQGATFYFLSDRCAATVVEIVSPKHVVVQFDKTTRTDKNGLSEDQTYTFECDPKGKKYHIRQGLRGAWRVSRGQDYGGTLVVLGERHEYRDPSF